MHRVRCKETKIAECKNNITAQQRNQMWIDGANTMLAEMRSDKEKRARGEHLPPRDTILGVRIPDIDKELGKSHYQKTAFKTLAKARRDAKVRFDDEEARIGISRSVAPVIVRTKVGAKANTAIPRSKVAAHAVAVATQVANRAKQRRICDGSMASISGKNTLILYIRGLDY